jgi:hypothetical protein
MRQSQRTSERSLETDGVHKRGSLSTGTGSRRQRRHSRDVAKVLLASLVVRRPQSPRRHHRRSGNSAPTVLSPSVATAAITGTVFRENVDKRVGAGFAFILLGAILLSLPQDGRFALRRRVAHEENSRHGNLRTLAAHDPVVCVFDQFATYVTA